MEQKRNPLALLGKMSHPFTSVGNLTDTQAAIAEYAEDRIRHGEEIAEIVAYLRTHGLPNLTVEQVTDWMASLAASRRGSAERDPFGGERDEQKRETNLETRLERAAATIPGAADIIGLGRLQALSGPPEEMTPAMAEFLSATLDFLVPEIRSSEARHISTSVCIPPGGRWETWDGGQRRTICTTLAVYDASGSLTAIHLRTRPRTSQSREHCRTTKLDVRRVVVDWKCDLHAVVVKLLQYVLTYRPGRHNPMSGKALAEAVDRTKQALSSQMLGIAARVRLASGGRAGCSRTRNLRPRGEKANAS